MSQCTHPHIFRLQTKDVYRCLGCGEAVKVIPYSEIAPGSTSMLIKIKATTPKDKL